MLTGGKKKFTDTKAKNYELLPSAALAKDGRTKNHELKAKN